VKTGMVILMVFGSLYFLSGIVSLIGITSPLTFFIYWIVAGVCFWGAKKLNNEIKKKRGEKK